MPHDPNMVLGEDCNLQCKKDKSNTKVAQVSSLGVIIQNTSPLSADQLESSIFGGHVMI